jgi:hypothetical protein
MSIDRKFGADFSKEDFESMEADMKGMTESMGRVAPEMGKVAGSMMFEMLKKFWWIFLIGLVFGGLMLWGVLELIKFVFF